MIFGCTCVEGFFIFFVRKMGDFLENGFLYKDASFIEKNSVLPKVLFKFASYKKYIEY